MKLLNVMKSLIIVEINTYKYKNEIILFEVYKKYWKHKFKSFKKSNGRTMALPKCSICGSKKSRFNKNQEAKGLLSNLGVRTPSSKVPVLGDILF